MPKPLPDKIKHQWRKKILQQRDSGLSIPAWCRQHEIAIYNFRYWQSKLFPEVLNRTSFTEIPLKKNEETGIYLEYREVKIHLSSRFDSEILKQCLEVLKKC